MHEEPNTRDSVLFSLGELRRIEREREKEAERARLREQERQNARQAEERRLAEAEARERDADRARERARLEREAEHARLRLRAVEQQAALESELARQRQEIALHELRRAAHGPLWIGGAVVVALILGFVVWGVREHRRQQQERRQRAAALAEIEAENRKIKGKMDELDEHFNNRSKVVVPRRDPSPLPAAVAASPPRPVRKPMGPGKKGTRPSASPPPLLDIERCKDSPDPLCNMPGEKKRRRHPRAR